MEKYWNILYILCIQWLKRTFPPDRYHCRFALQHLNCWSLFRNVLQHMCKWFHQITHISITFYSTLCDSQICFCVLIFFSNIMGFFIYQAIIAANMKLSSISRGAYHWSLQYNSPKWWIPFICAQTRRETRQDNEQEGTDGYTQYMNVCIKEPFTSRILYVDKMCLEKQQTLVLTISLLCITDTLRTNTFYLK